MTNLQIISITILLIIAACLYIWKFFADGSKDDKQEARNNKIPTDYLDDANPYEEIMREYQHEIEEAYKRRRGRYNLNKELHHINAMGIK